MVTTETIAMGDGVTTEFGFSFPYLKTEDVKVELQEYDATQTPGNQILSRQTITDFVVPSNNPTIVQFSSIGAATNYQAASGAPLANHAVSGFAIRVRIYRFTDTDNIPATFIQGSAVRAQDLNDNFEQTLYIMQERQNALLTIQTGGIGENVISTNALQDDSVDSSKLRDSAGDDSQRAVTTNHIRNNAVTTDKIVDDAVTTDKIVDDAVTTVKIVDDAVTTVKIVDDAVTTAKIVDDAVTTAKIVDDAVTTAKITDLNVTTGKLADSAVTSGKIADNTIVNADVNSAAAIDGTKINPDFGSQTITTTGNIDTASINSLNYPTAGPLSNRNLIINGDMRIAQRGTGAVTSAGYPVDRWLSNFSTAGAVSLQQSTAVTPDNFGYSIACTVTTADATTDASNQWNVQQYIEGYNIEQLLFGTADAKDVTVSFWVRGSVIGTYCMTLLGSSDGSTLDRSRVSEYTINSANTWEYKTITVPGDTGGTWTTDNGRGLAVRFGLTAGSNYQQSAGSWGTTNATGTANQTQLLETLNATWYVTGIQLEVGTVATPFEHRSYGDELARCQRYYEILRGGGGMYWGGGTRCGTATYKVEKRDTPSSVSISTIYYEYPASSTWQAININKHGYGIQKSGGGSYLIVDATWIVNAEL